MADKDYYRIPIFSRNNHEIGFQNMSFKLRSNDIFYVVEPTIQEYAGIKCANLITGAYIEIS
jgi:hypothetical protein